MNLEEANRLAVERLAQYVEAWVTHNAPNQLPPFLTELIVGHKQLTIDLRLKTPEAGAVEITVAYAWLTDELVKLTLGKAQ